MRVIRGHIANPTVRHLAILAITCADNHLIIATDMPLMSLSRSGGFHACVPICMHGADVHM
jgi:hypothetical protein